MIAMIEEKNPENLFNPVKIMVQTFATSPRASDDSSTMSAAISLFLSQPAKTQVHRSNMYVFLFIKHEPIGHYYSQKKAHKSLIYWFTRFMLLLKWAYAICSYSLFIFPMNHIVEPCPSDSKATPKRPIRNDGYEFNDF
ncbi:hypothetical protein AGMMS50239_21990 [Bacteroidia bacterium]|nr:hypothetical protein AGMMS50239_21990 [Bacteroidia bacterium]